MKRMNDNIDIQKFEEVQKHLAQVKEGLLKLSLIDGTLHENFAPMYKAALNFEKKYGEAFIGKPNKPLPQGYSLTNNSGG